MGAYIMCLLMQCEKRCRRFITMPSFTLNPMLLPTESRRIVHCIMLDLSHCSQCCFQHLYMHISNNDYDAFFSVDLSLYYDGAELRRLIPKRILALLACSIPVT